MNTTVGTLKVPGASLHHEVRGSGPVLLLIPGGPMDSDMFASLAKALAGSYTVVTYDPRGNSRSHLEGPPQEQRIQVHGDDASRLLASVGSEPAFVLGSSGGGTIGLELALRHPEQVRTLVAHEPPVVELLPDAARRRALTEELLDTYRREGAGAAMQQFVAQNGGPEPEAPGPGGPGPQPSPQMLAAIARTQGNLDFFFGQMFLPISGYMPAIASLRTGSTRIVVGVGEASRGLTAHQTGVALAERLGTDVVTFPGDHGGFAFHPTAFAETLMRVLAER